MLRNKKIYISALSVALAVMLVTGTFAWKQMITKTNEFIGTKTEVTLHDDFDPNTGAKDIYVENAGSMSVYIRVKLSEAMDLTSNKWRPADNDWTAHSYVKSEADCGGANAKGELFHDYFTWEMGGSKYYMPVTNGGDVVQDTKEYTAADAGAKLTPDARILTAAGYLALPTQEQESFVGWIYDTDGYAYWSKAVDKGEITGLLLHKVKTNEALYGTEYYYAIDVRVEAVDDKDIPMWTQGAASADGSGTKYPEATNAGKDILAIIAAGV